MSFQQHNFFKSVFCFVFYPSADKSISTTFLFSFIRGMVDLHNTFVRLL